jgi:hypothetical protein
MGSCPTPLEAGKRQSGGQNGLRIGSAPLSYRSEKPEKMRICHARMLLANAQSRVL